MKSTERTVTSNQEIVTISPAEYEAFQAQGKIISEFEDRVVILLDALRLDRYRQFGSSSERIFEDAMEQLSFLLNEAETCSDLVKAAEEDSAPAVPRKSRKKHEYALDNRPEGEALVCSN